MTLTSSAGLLAMFLVDLADLLYIAQLGEGHLTAAMGFATTLMFFGTALTIGLLIAISALASRKVGQGDQIYARRYLSNVMMVGLLIGVPIATVFWVFAEQLLGMIGASGKAQEAAVTYVRFVAPAMPFSIASMVCSGFLRGHGAARMAMTVTLTLAFFNAVLDPIFIFALGLGIKGAALATVSAAIASMLYALSAVVRHFGGFYRFSIRALRDDLPAISGILLPAVLTNLATPVGGALTYAFIASYGDDAVAGYAVIGRIVPVAFCLLFSLSGAVGPIIGQNYGAQQFSRIRTSLIQASMFATGYTLLIWPVLYFLSPLLSRYFNLGETGSELIFLFALVVAPLFLFNGLLFVANATFNNLERPMWSTALNWARNTLGILPFIWLGGKYYGLTGVLLGPAFGGVFFGLLALAIAFALVRSKTAKFLAESKQA